MAALVVSELASGGLDAKTVSVLGVLAALGGALRVLGAGTAGLEPMFFLLVRLRAGCSAAAPGSSWARCRCWSGRS